MQILIVDDKQAIIEQLKPFLAEYQCEIDCANNGLAALEKAQKKQYDIFIVDHLMPVMNGLQLVKNLGKKQLLTKAKLFFMTTQGADTVSVTPEAQLFDGLIEKPISLAKFSELLDPLFPEINTLRSVSN